MPETRIWSLGREDPLEKELATHSSILAWRLPWTEGPGRLQSTGSQESDTTERLNHHHWGRRQKQGNEKCSLRPPMDYEKIIDTEGILLMVIIEKNYGCTIIVCWRVPRHR